VFNLWNLTDVEKTHKVIHVSSHPIGPEVYGLALNPDKKLLAVGTKDGKLRVWDIGDPREPKGVEIPHAHGNENQPVEAISFSHDGSLLATGGEDQQVVLWKVTSSDSGIQVKAIPGTLSQSQSILSLTFSSDGKTLAAGDAEGVTCLYQVANRSSIGAHACLVGHLPGEIGGVEVVKFAHLGHGETVLLTAGTGQPVLAWKSILWSLGDTDGVDQAIANDVCALASRNLTSDEWNNAFASTNLAGDRHQTCPEYP
jgi:WD40 repeat protein